MARPKKELTPEQQAEKLRKEKEKQFIYNCNRIRGEFSFGRIKNFGDLLQSIGYDKSTFYLLPQEQLDAPVSIVDINTLLKNIQLRADMEEWQKIEGADKPEKHEYEGITFDPTVQIVIDQIFTPDGQIIIPKDQPKEDNPNNDDAKAYAKKHPEEEITNTEEELLFDKWLLPREGKIAQLFNFQKRAAVKILRAFYEEHHRAELLLAAVGTGKTFIIAEVICQLYNRNFFDNVISPWPCCYITKATIVEQTTRVLRDKFGLDTVNEVNVINIEQLRASFGEIFIEWETVVEDGVEHERCKWREGINPKVMIWDECQVLKNTYSLQSKVAQAYNDLESYTLQIFSSATPFTRVCEAKCFCVATKIPHDFGFAKNIPLINKHWNDFADSIADPASPIEHNEAAVERLMKKMLAFVCDVKGVRPQFSCKNGIKIIEFQTEAEAEEYRTAWDRYLEEKAKIEGDEGLSKAKSRMMILVQFLKFRMAAELIRAPYIAQWMYEHVEEGYAACAAMCFKESISKCTRILVEKYGVPRDKISLIWGGGKTKPTNKMKKKKQAKEQAEALAELGLTLEDLGLADVDDIPEIQEIIPPELRLGVQSKQERQREIDRFQSGHALYCLYTFKSGGVGLSLHHTDEMTSTYNQEAPDYDTWAAEIETWNNHRPLNGRLQPGKARRRKNGFVFEDDIPFIPTRPRVSILTPTYSAIELVQGLGRAPRLTSLSPTTQFVCFYAGTIEVRVAATVSIKLRCLRKVVRKRESWEDVIVGGFVKRDEDYSAETDTVIGESKQLEDTKDTEDSDVLYGENPDEEEEDDDDSGEDWKKGDK